MKTQLVYPGAVAMAKLGVASTALYKRMLIKAVEELGGINLPRMKHIQAVAATLEAAARRDAAFLFDRIPEKIKTAEMHEYQLSAAGYQEKYQKEISQIFDAYARLSPEAKEILELAVWAHDLGVPFGIEWEHAANGAKVTRQMIRDRRLREPIAALVYHHGQFSNLTSSSFPQDIYELSANLRPALFILDFCDATGRIDRDGNQSNPIGLKCLEFYLRVMPPSGLIQFEKAESLFGIRVRYGFGPIIFNRAIDQEAQKTIFRQAAQSIPAATPRQLMDFYGSKFRCHFMDILLSALDSAEDKGLLFTLIYKAYREAEMSGDALLWPDQDLGRRLGTKEGFTDFVDKLKLYVSQKGMNNLLKAEPSKGRIIFLTSKIA